MSVEQIVLLAGVGLALLHIFAASTVRTRDYGVAWNVGARDERLPDPSPLAGRLARAQVNYFETFPIAIALLLLVGQTGLGNRLTAAGAVIWLGARLVYLPVYAAGIAVVRSLIFMVAMLGLVMVAMPMLTSLI